MILLKNLTIYIKLILLSNVDIMLYSMLTLIFKFSFKLNCFNELNTDLFTLKFNADISKYFVYLHVELWLHKTLNDVILK